MELDSLCKKQCHFGENKYMETAGKQTQVDCYLMLETSRAWSIPLCNIECLTVVKSGALTLIRPLFRAPSLLKWSDCFLNFHRVPWDTGCKIARELPLSNIPATRQRRILFRTLLCAFTVIEHWFMLVGLLSEKLYQHWPLSYSPLGL